MVIVSDKGREEVLAIYRPEQRILLEANVEYPKIEGKFLIGKCYYALADLEHATDIEIQLCLNQLSFAGIYQVIKEGTDPLLSGLDFKKLQKEGMVITESYKRFRRPIPIDREISGELTFRDFKERKGVIFAGADFQFEDRKCLGRLEFAIIDK